LPKLETPFALAVDRQLVPLESLDCRRKMQLLLRAYVHVGKHHSGVIRSTFVVDEKGKIAVAQYNVKAAHTTTNIPKIIAQIA
jgi:peroxiredoxin